MTNTRRCLINYPGLETGRIIGVLRTQYRVLVCSLINCITHTAICVKYNLQQQIMAPGKKTKIVIIIINILETVLQGVSIYYFHVARSPILDNTPFWTEFGSSNVPLPHFAVNVARSFGTLFLFRIPWITLCLILDFEEVSNDATDVSVVVTFDIFAVYSMVASLTTMISAYRSLRRSSRTDEVADSHFFKFKPTSWYSYIQLLCLNVVRFSMSKSIDRVWILSTICYVLSVISQGLTRRFVDWEAINEKTKGMTRNAVDRLVLSHIKKQLSIQEKKETVVAIDAAQLPTSQPIDAAQPLMSQPTSESND